MGKIHPKQIVLYTDPDFILSSDQLIPSVKATKDYVDTKIQLVSNNSEYHTILVAGQDSYDITHNMNNYYLVADVWTAGTNGENQIVPAERIYPQILIIDNNTVRVNFNSVTEVDTILVMIAKYVNPDNNNVELVDNDIEVLDHTKGIILRSPNNTRFRITVSDNGSIITTSL